MPELNLSPELVKLENFLEKYVKTMKEEVDRCDEKLKSGEFSEKQQSELQNQKQELEKKIEKAQSCLDKIRVSESSNFIELGQPKKHWGSTEGLDKPLCERYDFLVGEKLITLDIPHSLLTELEIELGKNIPYPFYLSASALEKEEVWKGITIEKKEEIFIQKSLTQEETNQGKIVGTLSGVGAGAASGAAVGAGAMVALSPWTFGLSLSLVPAAAAIGAITGSVGGGATGLVAGSISDKISNSKIVEAKKEIEGFLEDYKTMMEKESRDCQDIINNEASTPEKKEESQKQKEDYENEVSEIKAYIESNNWK